MITLDRAGLAGLIMASAILSRPWSTGPAFSGYLGSDARMKYGVFGAHAVRERSERCGVGVGEVRMSRGTCVV